MTSTQYLVIGAGLAGAATAWQLARRGLEVTVVERSRPANAQGSSHGSARILRYTYPDRLYTDLVREAKDGWDELDEWSDAPLFVPAGCVDFGVREHVRALEATLTEVGIAHELLPREEAVGRWPGFAFDSDVLWHDSAGTIDAESAVLAMTALAQRAGARLLLDWPVQRVQRRTDGFRVTSEHGETIDAERIVLAVGGWLPDLLQRVPLSAAFRAAMPALQVRQEQAFHFPYREQPVAATQWPTLIHQRDSTDVYGLPGGRDAGFAGHKVAQYNGGKVLRSAADQDGVVDPANRQVVIDYVTRYLPGLVPEPYAETTCLFTNTPTEDFIVDGEDGITVLSPCSGHGAKFAPAIGRITADVVTGVARAPERFRVAGISA